MIIWFVFVLGALSAAGTVFITEVGQTVILECGASQAHQVEWNRDQVQIIRINTKTGYSSKGTSPVSKRSRLLSDKDLQISPVEVGDAGRFICQADRTQYEHTLIVVSASVVPSTHLKDGTEATLQCLVSEPEPKTSKVQWKKPDGSTENSPTVQLKPFTASHGGNWQCVVTNGEKEFTKDLAITVQETVRQTPVPSQNQPSLPNPSHSPNPNSSSNSNQSKGTEWIYLGLVWWYWVAIGVGCLTVIILIVVIIVMVRRIKRKKRKLQKMKNARLSKNPKKYCQCKHKTAAPKPQGRRREKPSALQLQPLLKE